MSSSELGSCVQPVKRNSVLAAYEDRDGRQFKPRFAPLVLSGGFCVLGSYRVFASFLGGVDLGSA